MPDNTLAQISATFDSLDGDNYHLAYSKCTSQDQRDELVQLRDAARDAYFKALADGLGADSSLVQNLTNQLTTTNQNIQSSLKNLTDIVAFLSLANDAVKLAASLATLASTA